MRIARFDAKWAGAAATISAITVGLSPSHFYILLLLLGGLLFGERVAATRPGITSTAVMRDIDSFPFIPGVRFWCS